MFHSMEDRLRKIASSMEQTALVEKSAVVRKVPGKEKWRVLSEKGKSLGEYDSKAKAETRLKQIEMFKHMKGKKRKSSEPLELFNEYLCLAGRMMPPPVFGQEKLAQALEQAAKSSPRLASVIGRVPQ